MTAIPPSGKIGDRLVTSFVTPWPSIMVRARRDELQRCHGGRPVSGLRLWSARVCPFLASGLASPPTTAPCKLRQSPSPR